MESSSLERQSNYVQHKREDVPAAATDTPFAPVRAPFHFHHHCGGTMAMNADVESVADYLNAHAGWFVRCARPMAAEPLSDRGYALTIGRFGAFGYEVEPKIGIELMPPEGCCYRMQTVPIPGYLLQGYNVDYRATLEIQQSPDAGCTHVDWTLDLGVAVHFPGFIHRLPRKLIQNTGDRLLSQIVRQVSRRLTRKVQEDFHSRLNASLPDGEHPLET
ncbi:protein of unknown function (DUF1997) [Rubidibacter lacunae KORDI 51-2]|uniref:Polyketide cyclase / dehydrase and lipid transport n=1 Tax=Rubidibacter lacunae KORDI 51-2 TaxID=582515 RepID=U5DPS8_9CHRO|nr:DUF1997 domain-containing protein [Rubidibacter lacunae]ERN42589.1 protein of unknown function (DUF1997) [Rubidibacter lacunae KORDI 51-2]